MLNKRVQIRFSNKIIKEKRALNCPHLKEAIKFKAKLNKMIITNGNNKINEIELKPKNFSKLS